jgi:hypothetical protein
MSEPRGPSIAHVRLAVYVFHPDSVSQSHAVVSCQQRYGTQMSSEGGTSPLVETPSKAATRVP